MPLEVLGHERNQPLASSEERLSPVEPKLKLGKEVLRNMEGGVDPWIEEQRGGAISYKFNFTVHTEENAAEIVASLRDCDIIAIEGIGGMDEVRSRDEILHTQLTSDTVPLDMVKQRSAFLTNHGAGFMGKVLENLAGSNKRIVGIDMPASDPNAHLLLEADEAESSFYTAIGANESNDELRQRYIHYLTVLAFTHVKREELVIKQLSALGDSLDKETPKKLAW